MSIPGQTSSPPATVPDTWDDGDDDIDDSFITSSPPVSCDPSCRCASYSQYVLFVNASDPAPRPYYYIDTTWTVHHPWQIQHALTEAGFQVIDENDETYGPVPYCGFNQLFTTHALGVRRGNFAVNGTADLPTGQLGIGSEIKQLLQETYPFVEIFLAVSILMSVLVAYVGLHLCGCLVYSLRSTTWRRNPRRPSHTAPAASKAKKNESRCLPWKKSTPDLRCRNSSSALLNLPNELQELVLSYCTFAELVQLKRSCHYYNTMIDESRLAPLRGPYRKELFDESSQHRAELACSKCLVKWPVHKFEVTHHTTPPTARMCINCHQKKGDYRNGQIIETATTIIHDRGNRWNRENEARRVLCVACQQLIPVGHDTGYHAKGSVTWYEKYVIRGSNFWCKTCSARSTVLYDKVVVLRVVQVVFLIIILALTNSGTVPARLWSWVYLVVLHWLTICYMLGNFGYRIEGQLDGISCEPMIFEFLVILAWFGIASGMTYEATKPTSLLLAPYDAHGKTLIAFCYIQGLSFSWSFWYAFKYQRRWLEHRKAVEWREKVSIV